MVNTELFDIEKFRLKTISYIPAFKHTADCLYIVDGPCTCGLEEVLEDETLEDAPEES